KGLTIPEICKSRKFKHFKDLYRDKYDVLINGYYLIYHKDIKIEDNILDLVAEYDNRYYKMDTYYRRFYYHLDKVEDNSIFEDLQTLVENIYINQYLDIISKTFSHKLDYDHLKQKYKLQKDFYTHFIAGKNERMIVIISDAFRYEVAKELVQRFKYNEKVEAKIEPQIGVLPSYTSLGMAALLPNNSIEIMDDYSVYVDGKPTNNLVERNAILQSKNFKSDCIQYDDLIKMKKEDMREFFSGKEVLYIYHNQIDARGDKLNTEDEVFVACYEAMEEIEDLIKRLTNNISATRFIVTADHGFIYTRRKNKESEKIDKFFSKDDKVNRRFIISDNSYDILGTKNMIVSDVLGNYDERTITMPLTSNVFKVQGGGQNFVHGGSSPQEIVVPVIKIKTTRGAVEVEKVKISLISMISKITSLLLSLDFVQQEPISDIIKPANYKIGFIDKSGKLISNEEIYVAKSKSSNSSDRIFNLKFRLRNKKYNRNEEYYFIITDIETGIEIYKQQVIIDIAFADDFGFDI
ncbi:MAG: BREX-1 system phosphatase PglZ type A, partial [Epulopiscium sp.]|nr:BREX-1 system phosphatase PglZ type A [Candidatus Epulonipiscium sp.]